MLRRLCLIIISICCFSPDMGHSVETIRVVVLPFETHAVKDLSYAQTELSDMIKKNLEQEGVVILDPEVIPDFSWKKGMGTVEVRNFGVENGADYVVWGSLTWIRQKFILVTKMLESFGEEAESISTIGLQCYPGAWCGGFGGRQGASFGQLQVNERTKRFSKWVRGES